MNTARVVVDGSNIATEGRSTPSLAQLDEAVRQLHEELPDHEIIVVVDATFGHRIDPAERAQYEEAEAHGELISPPAGTIGRGDAFLLQVAARAGAVVLSNDSFQEFHGDHPWLFEPGRLLGGKPIPGIGWVFTPRTPVRGVKSRKATAAAKGTKRTAAKSSTLAALLGAAAPSPAPTPSPAAEAAANGSARRRRRRSSPASSASPASAPAAPPTPAEDRAPSPVPTEATGRSPRTSAEPLNEPLTFLTFIADHPIGTRLDAVVEGFVSHGAMVRVGDMRCYVPLRNLADPPPTRARAVLSRGEQRTFVLVALDPLRRGAELALPEVAERRGLSLPEPPPPTTSATKTSARKTPHTPTQPLDDTPAEASTKAAAKKTPATKTAAKKTAAKRTATKETPDTTVAPTTRTRATQTHKLHNASEDTTPAPTKRRTKKTTAETTTEAPATTPTDATPASTPTKTTTKAAAKKTPATKTAAKKTAAKRTATKETPDTTVARSGSTRARPQTTTGTR
ncbi:hypothetical protein ACFFRE_03300 [Aciditerrimonas ferrireducens]|uniref:RNase NYN domain-containing protein n=1 Tax=Aciditerrimonas ferrireducens TaxID=667306 RepID=A0ABV6C0H8_9ACTN|nr:hypothetical protein [Aciditerrimonas ferrireducens]MCK4177450.1 hypothetical protein [Aciditerrimonas ferrireducens]